MKRKLIFGDFTLYDSIEKSKIYLICYFYVFCCLDASEKVVQRWFSDSGYD